MGAANTKRVRKPRKGARGEDGESAGEVRTRGSASSARLTSAQKSAIDNFTRAAKDYKRLIDESNKLNSLPILNDRQLNRASVLGPRVLLANRKYRNAEDDAKKKLSKEKFREVSAKVNPFG